MSTFITDPAMSAALWIAVKASVFVGVAAIVQAAVYRHTSAATRHLVWTLAIVGMLLLPMLSLALPDWAVVIRTAPTAADAAPVMDQFDESINPANSAADVAISAEPAPTAPRPLDVSWSTALVSLYAAGVIVMLIQLTMHQWSVRRFARLASDEQDSEWSRLLTECIVHMGLRRPVRLLRSRELTVPMAFGTRCPSILIPVIGDTWPDNRQRAVVLHELAHIARYDCLTQTLAFAACAMYWFHPAAWWVARRLRIERELACDDLVIEAGTEGREYAGHLLEIAYSFGSHRAPALAVSMARPHQLESRMLAALDAARNRSVPTFRVRVASAAIAALLLFPLACARPTTVAADTNTQGAPAPTTWAAPPTGPEYVVRLKAVQGPLFAPVHRVIRAAAAVIGIAQGNLPGTWDIRPTTTEGTVHLRLFELNSSSGSNIPIERLDGLTAAQLAGAGGPVQFRLRRDAGTFTFEGVLRNGVGAGTFSFTPDPNFPAELAKRGFARPTAREQYQMARHDIGYAFVDELNKQGYSKPNTSELVRAGQHGVDVSYLREMGALGYRAGSLEQLVTLRDHGVTPAYVRALAELGYKNLSADELQRARDHGVSPEYVRGMRNLGYSSVLLEDLIKARDHGVSEEFVRELGDAGLRKLSLDNLIRARDHGVSPDYARDMRQLGYQVSLDDLIRARDHGVSVDFVREVAALGYTGLSMDSLVRLRDHGVTPKYAQELKALGYDRLTVDDLVTLRDRGLTPDRIRAMNARAGTRLPIDMLKSLAAGGIR